MLPGKAAVFLLLLCSVVCVHQVNSDELVCTEKQKEAILSKCEHILTRGSFAIIKPRKGSECCVKVRDVPHIDMNCIVKLLTCQEGMEYVGTRILKLQHDCS
uniref:Betl4 n=1 Tax=Arundo donax TaxID=35708 RepID=A0A0A9GWP1_ARUDO